MSRTHDDQYFAEKEVDRLFEELRGELSRSRPDEILPFLMQRIGRMMDPSPETGSSLSFVSRQERWPETLNQKALTIVVFGASGDLAWKKTYPALYELWCTGLLPRHVSILGYARSPMDHARFLKRISGRFPEMPDYLQTTFLDRCHYLSGSYDDTPSFVRLRAEMERLEAASRPAPTSANRCFYLALPPSVFTEVCKGVRHNCMSASGWNHMIVEKPFGRDLASATMLAQDLGSLFTEDQIYRIDHYLGKEMVQNLISIRFANKVLSSVWNNNCIANIQITFKEPFGTEGRGGYFDQFGIIRDIIQNHLLQVLTMVAMERPKSLSADHVRDEKVHVLRSVRAINPQNVVLGQYVKKPDGEGETYTEDPTVPDDSRTPTFATVVMFIDNDRWEGVPWILKAGKATNERKAEIRIQFKNELLPYREKALRDELVMRLQPAEAIYLKLMTKKPGLHATGELTQTELDLMYQTRYEDLHLPDAYSGLLYDCICGNQRQFVRTDELMEAWKLFTPLLEHIEAKKVEPAPYYFGSRGPKESDNLIQRFGYVYEPGYVWHSPASPLT